MPVTYKEQLVKVINAVGVLGQAFAAPVIPAGGQVAVGALTATTRFTVAHGLGYKPNLWAISTRVMANADDTTAAFGLALVSADTTNVTLKPSISVTAANTSFLLLIELDTDVGGRNYAF